MLKILFLAISLAHCQEQEGLPKIAQYRDFSGGINDVTSPIYLNPNESPKIENFLIDEKSGALVVRKGFTSFGTLPSGNVPTGIWAFVADTGTGTIVVSDSSNFYYTNNGSSYVFIRGGLDATTVSDCEMVYNDLWCTNGSNSVWRWPGPPSTGTIMNGAVNVPNVPLGEWIEFEKDTVWVGRTSGGRSSVFFSNRTNPSDGGIIRPSSAAAWPGLNELRVAQNDGDSLRGLKKYLGTLVACKENSVHILNGGDEFDFNFERVLDNIGCSNNTMVEADGLLYFAGKRGVFKFNGKNAEKISDKIDNFWKSVNLPSTNRQVNEWTSQADFEQATSTNNTELNNPAGSVRIVEKVLLDNFDDGDFSSNPAWTVTGASNFSINSNKLRFNPSTPFSSSQIETGMIHSTGTFQFNYQMVSGGSQFTLNIAISTSAVGGTIGPGYAVSILPSGNAIYINRIAPNGSTEAEILNKVGLSLGSSDHLIKFTRSNVGAFELFIDSVSVATGSDSTYTNMNKISIYHATIACGSDCTGFDARIDNIFRATSTLTATFISNIFNAGSDLTVWSNFELDSTLNSQTLVTGIRTGSSQAALQGKQFAAISNGAQVSTAPAETFVQWTATFTSNNGANSPIIEAVRTNWSEGGAATVNPAAGYINDRYWLSVATGATPTKHAVLVKSKDSDNFTLFTGTSNFNGFIKFDGNYYAASSTNSSVYHVENGNNDNGNTINAVWESKDETWGIPQNSKRLSELFLDYEGASSARSVSVDYSLNSGNTFTNISSPDLQGTGRVTRNLYINSGVHGLDIRHRIRASNLDAPVTLYGLDSISRVLPVRN